jgi:hypothetical protein
MYIFILKKNHIDTFGNTLYDLRIKHYTPFGDKWRVIYRFSFYGCETTRNVRRVEHRRHFTASIGSVVSVLLAVSQDWRP